MKTGEASESKSEDTNRSIIIQRIDCKRNGVAYRNGKIVQKHHPCQKRSHVVQITSQAFERHQRRNPSDIMASVGRFGDERVKRVDGNNPARRVIDKDNTVVDNTRLGDKQPRSRKPFHEHQPSEKSLTPFGTCSECVDNNLIDQFIFSGITSIPRDSRIKLSLGNAMFLKNGFVILVVIQISIRHRLLSVEHRLSNMQIYEDTGHLLL